MEHYFVFPSKLEMTSLMRLLARSTGRGAQTTTEYALIVALVAVAALGAYNFFGGSLTDLVINLVKAL